MLSARPHCGLRRPQDRDAVLSEPRWRQQSISSVLYSVHVLPSVDVGGDGGLRGRVECCLLYTSPSPRD
eukprot:12972467-Alexandrium_andersonii.AAC.1